MNPDRPGARVTGMSGPTTIRLLCEIDAPGDPIRGRLIDEHGVATSFRGWIELAAALGSLVDAADPSEPARGAPDE